jgi:hypothetical protein
VQGFGSKGGPTQRERKEDLRMSPEKIDQLVRQAIAAAQEAGDLPAFEVGDTGIERPADTSHGEWTSTVALRSAKLAHMAPKAIAEALAAHIPSGEGISKVGEIIDLGVEFGIVKKSGAWFSYEGTKLGQGRDAAKQMVADNPELAEELETKIKEAMRAK